MTTLYRKEGRRYRPVGQEFLGVYTPGWWCVQVTQTGSRALPLPDVLPSCDVVALCERMRPILERELTQHMAPHPPRVLTEREQRAYAAYAAVMGGDFPMRLETESISAIVNAALGAVYADITKEDTYANF